MRHYDSVLLAYGASEDKKLAIPGESTLSGIYSARQFVGWYNGLPECADLKPNLSRAEDVVVIGQGNVALDVARILLEDVDALRKTDMTEHALVELATSRVKRVHVVGRRGPMQVRCHVCRSTLPAIHVLDEKGLMLVRPHSPSRRYGS